MMREPARGFVSPPFGRSRFDALTETRMRDSWAEAHDPLEMLELLREPPQHYPESRREQHAELLNTYTLRCLRGIGADYEADIFCDHAFGHAGSASHLDYHIERLAERAGARSGGGYSQGRKPRRIPVHAQRAQAAITAINALGAGGSPWHAAVAVTRETQHLIQGEQCEWLRCLFPDPHGSSTIERDWLTSTVVDLIRGISAENAFDRLPILADALQDAGCDNEELLHHCRHGTHGMHCWAVSAVLDAV